jgi:hypothetical protein
LGFTTLRWTYTAKDGDAVNGAKTYRVEGVPQQQWYYTRVASLIAADGFMPIQRDFFDPAGQPLKVERFGNVKTVNGVPTRPRTGRHAVEEPDDAAITDLAYDAQAGRAAPGRRASPKAVSSPGWERRSRRCRRATPLGRNS